MERKQWRHPCSRPIAFPIPPRSHAAASDYDTVRRAVAFISAQWRQQPEIEEIAHASRRHRDRAASPVPPLGRAHAQGVPAGDYARPRAQLLRDSASVLDAAYEVGLSGPGRLHDLFVTHEAMSPGEWKAGGEGLTLHYGFHPSPFGTALIMATPRGLAGLAFADPGEEQAALADMTQPLAEGALCRGHCAHRAARSAHLRSKPVARRPAAARRADRHRLGDSRVGGAAEGADGPRHHLFRHRQKGLHARRRRAPSAPRSARIRSASWCRAIA